MYLSYNIDQMHQLSNESKKELSFINRIGGSNMFLWNFYKNMWSQNIENQNVYTN
jgi:hypothetical protein